MKKKVLCIVLVVLLCALCALEAQWRKIPRIGYLTSFGAPTGASVRCVSARAERVRLRRGENRRH